MPEQPQNQDKEAEKIIAYHEAGHVLMNYYLGWKVSSFGFVDETKTHGITNSDKSADKDYQWVASLKSLKEATDDERELIIAKKENRALLAMAGEVSQKKFQNSRLDTLMQFSHYWNEEEKSDILTIKKIQKELKDELGYPLHGKNMIIRCKQIIDGNWPIIVDLAETMYSSDQLIIDQVHIVEILAKHNFKTSN